MAGPWPPTKWLVRAGSVEKVCFPPRVRPPRALERGPSKGRVSFSLPSARTGPGPWEELGTRLWNNRARRARKTLLTSAMFAGTIALQSVSHKSRICDPLLEGIYPDDDNHFLWASPLAGVFAEKEKAR